MHLRVVVEAVRAPKLAGQAFRSHPQRLAKTVADLRVGKRCGGRPSADPQLFAQSAGRLVQFFEKPLSLRRPGKQQRQRDSADNFRLTHRIRLHICYAQPILSTVELYHIC